MTPEQFNTLYAGKQKIVIYADAHSRDKHKHLFSDSKHFVIGDPLTGQRADVILMFMCFYHLYPAEFINWLTEAVVTRLSADNATLIWIET